MYTRMRGNEAANTLAKLAHKNASVAQATFQDPCDRGPAWIQTHARPDVADLGSLKSPKSSPCDFLQLTL